MMNETETRKYDMLIRVRDFGAKHAPAFPPESLAGALLAQIASSVEELSSHSAAQTEGAGAVREATALRARAREALRDDLEALGRTARALAARLPHVDEKFRMPPTGRDQALLDSARAFAAEGRRLEGEFAERGLGAEFFAKLEADTAAFEGVLAAQRQAKEARKAATAAIDGALATGVSAVRQLDPIVCNKFAADAMALLSWESARRVQRAGRGRSGQGESTEPVSESAGVPETMT